MGEGGSGARALALAAAGASAVALGYQVQRPATIPASSLASVVSYSGFEPSERGYRWSGSHAEVRFRDAAPGVPTRVEIDLVAWRGRDSPPSVTVRALGQTLAVAPAPGRQTVRATGAASGWWRSDVVVSIDSDTVLRPGEDESPPVGVRVTEARLIPDRTLGGRPPLEPVVLGALAAVLAFRLAVAMGASPSSALTLALGLCAVAVPLWGWARPWAALLGRPLAVALAAALLSLRFAPRPARLVARALAHSLAAFREGLRVVVSPALAALLVLGAAGLVAAHRSRPLLQIDLASARAVPLSRGFGPVETEDGVAFREARQSSELDLAGFGGGAPWTIQVTAALAGEPQELVLAEARGASLRLPLGTAWTTGSFQATAVAGWAGGLRLAFPSGGRGSGLRIRSVRIDRGRSWPAPRVLAAQTAAPALLALAFAVLGIRRRAACAAALAVFLVELSSLVADPVTAATFAPTLAGIVACALLLTFFAAGVYRLAAGGQGVEIESLPAAALAAACAGFVGWFSSMAFPLFDGGHFYWHSAAAEELWRGHFLEYYLPEGESIMARQVQWGGIVVPNPFLYHLLMAPLSALPRAWFHWAEKGVLALMFASLVVLASLLAGHVGGRRAAARAAVVAAAFVTTYQLLALGHLAAVFGTFASSWALGYAVLRYGQLAARVTSLVLGLLLTAAFLSYTPSVMFTALVIALVPALLYFRDRVAAVALARAGAIAAVLAFLLYYVHWTLPFLTRSLPALAGSESGASDFSLRIAREPGNLVYSYGSILVPIAGLLGLFLHRRGGGERLILIVWAGLLVPFTGLDVLFNFLRKHHFFVIVPLEAGCGLLLARLEGSGRAGRLLAWTLLAGAIALGARAALDTAVVLR